MPLKRGATEPTPDEPGMQPDDADDAAGHIRGRSAQEPAPDEPGGDNAEGHAMKGKFAKEPAPDEPGGDQPGPDEAGKFRI